MGRDETRRGEARRGRMRWDGVGMGRRGAHVLSTSTVESTRDADDSSERDTRWGHDVQMDADGVDVSCVVWERARWGVGRGVCSVHGEGTRYGMGERVWRDGGWERTATRRASTREQESIARESAGANGRARVCDGPQECPMRSIRAPIQIRTNARRAKTTATTT